MKLSAEALKITVTRLDARDRASLALALDTLGTLHPDALLVTDSVAVVNANELIDRATAIRVPVVHFWPGTVERGALLSYQARRS